MGTQTRLTALGLAELGHDVVVVSRGLQRREDGEDGVHVVRIIGMENRGGGETELADQVTYSTEVAVELQRLHADAALDLVVFPEFGNEGFVFLLNQLEYRRVPAVVHLHGPIVLFAHTIGWPDIDSEEYRVGTAIEAACLRMADAVSSSSGCSADWAARHYGIERGRIRVLHSGVDTKAFRPLTVPRDDRPTIAFVGNVVENKGVHLLLQATHEVAEHVPGVRLRVIGRADAEPLERLLALEEELGGGVLELAGFVEHTHLPEELAGADVFAAPSIYEPGPGYSLLEAMACGLPVVTTDGGGAAEIVTNDDTGLVVPSNDRAALAKALRGLFEDGQLRQTLGARARAWTVENMDWRIWIRRIEHFYTEVAGSLR
jgi:glycosyltransferase involved in cell wall biosynthesis